MKDSPELMPVNVVELKVSKAVSQLLASTSEQPGEDQESWGPERQAAVDEAEKAVETAVGEASDPAAEKSDVVLYTVACFYARLYVMEVIGRGELPSVGGVSESSRGRFVVLLTPSPETRNSRSKRSTTPTCRRSAVTWTN